MPKHIAGTEMYAYSLQKNLNAQGYSVGIIIPGFDIVEPSEYEYDGLRVLQYPQHKAQPQEIKGIVPPSGLDAFRALVTKVKPDILHFHEISGSNGITLWHLAVAKELGIRVFITFHLVGYTCLSGTLIEHGKGQCDGKIGAFRCSVCYLKSTKNLGQTTASAAAMTSLMLGRLGIHTYGMNSRLATLLGVSNLVERQHQRLTFLSSICEKMVVLNPWFRDILVKNGVPSSKLVMVPQGVTGDRMQLTPINNSTGKLRLVFVGRIHWSKGLDVLLRALSSLSPGSFSLDIYGPESDPNYKFECLGLIERGMEVNWKGLIQPGESPSVLSGYDVVCLPSRVTEMSPLIIEEAFLAKVPVIASHVYGNAYRIRPNMNGWLFPVGDSRALAEKLMKVIANRALHSEMLFGEENPMTFHDIAKKYAELYQNT